VRHLQEIREVEQTRMGNTAKKKSSKEGETKNKMPPDSLLGQMLKYWSNNPRTKAKRISK
jgi:hypothetical protein